VAGCCANGNEPLGCIQYSELLEKMKINYLLKKDFVPWSQLVSLFVSCFLEVTIISMTVLTTDY
jgi:hypothetical protein